MFIQYGVRVIAITYVILGLIGFLPLDAVNPLHPEGVGVRYLLNQVSINPLHNLIHLATGLTGLYAARNLSDSRLWGKIVGVTFLLLFAVGMVQGLAEGFPPDHLLLGLVPLNPPAHILHLCTGALALYLGLVPLVRDRIDAKQETTP